MPYQFPPDVDERVKERMATGRYATEDDVLRDALESLTSEDEELCAIDEAIEALENGDEGVPVAEAFDRLREKYNVHSNG